MTDPVSAYFAESLAPESPAARRSALAIPQAFERRRLRYPGSLALLFGAKSDQSSLRQRPPPLLRPSPIPATAWPASIRPRPAPRPAVARQIPPAALRLAPPAAAARPVAPAAPEVPPALSRNPHTDRKSTRLNSSHLVISYAVFCLKKKKHIHKT